MLDFEPSVIPTIIVPIFGLDVAPIGPVVDPVIVALCFVLVFVGKLMHFDLVDFE